MRRLHVIISVTAEFIFTIPFVKYGDQNLSGLSEFILTF